MKTPLVVVAIIAASVGSATWAAPKTWPKLTPEQRQKMAEAHEKMAACLKSDKPIEQCREEMMKACQDNLGKDGCPMMGMHHEHGQGMHLGMGQDKGSADQTEAGKQ